MSHLERIVCTYCGADIEFAPDSKSASCKYCNSKFHFKEEKGPALILALNNAAGYLSRHDFDSAIVHYGSVLKEYPNDAEAAWGHAISTYGIVYEKDDRTGNMIPTCSRIVKESILDNRSYKLAIANCTDEQRDIYEDGAAFIDRVQKKIKRAMEDEEDFDVFISFKAKDENGITTEDSVIARNIYDELKKRGIKAFFSEVTLKNRFGDEFEPIIYRALYSCKFFILVSTKEAYIEAPWVKNEWTRFRDRVMDEGLSGACAAVYKNFSAYSLPRLFQSQGIELEKHPFDYAQLVADNLAVKLGFSNKEKEALEEQMRRNAELEEKQRKMEEELERLRTQSTAASAPAMDMNAFAEMYRKMEEEKAKAEVEAQRKAEEERAKADAEAQRKAEEERAKADAEAQRKAEEEKARAEVKKNEEAPTEESSDDMEIVDGVLIEYTGEQSEVVIPEGVTAIGDQAFFLCDTITSLVIPEGVTTIGEDAFYGCDSLTSMVIPDGVTTIVAGAFCSCGSLTSIVIPDSVTTIGDSAFFDCSKLTKIYYTGSEEQCAAISVGDDNDVLSDADVICNYKPKEKMAIADGVLVKYAGEQSEVVIPDGVTAIDAFAFENCDILTSVVIPDSVTAIGGNAFADCQKLTNVYYKGNVEQWDAISVRTGNGPLTDADIIYNYKSSEEIGDNHKSHVGVAEYDVNDMTVVDGVLTEYTGTQSRLVIPHGVTAIGDDAFDECENLTSVVIPDSVTTIGEDVFGSCPDLSSIEVDANNKHYKSIEGNLYSKDGKVILRYPKGKEESNFIIPDGVTVIGDKAFLCSNLTSVVIPDSVTAIGESAFDFCESLESIVIPDSVITIGKSAFEMCENLVSVVIPDSVTNIGDSAFYWCSSLTSIEVDANNKHYKSVDGNLYTKDGRMLLHYSAAKEASDFVIPNGVTTINNFACYCCENLTSVVIPEGVTTIGDNAFYGCINLTSIVIPDSVTTIGGEAFDSCGNLTNVYYTGSEEQWRKVLIEVLNDELLNARITYDHISSENDEKKKVEALRRLSENYADEMEIENGVLVKYKGNKSEVVIPEGVTSIGNYAFYNCTALSSVVIPDSVTAIGNQAFLRCSNLKSLVIGKGVTTIGKYAFQECSALTSLVIPDSVKVIDERAFYYCKRLASVVISDNVAIIGTAAFGECDILKKIYYEGSENQWGEISYRGDNGLRYSVNITYNYLPENGEEAIKARQKKRRLLADKYADEMKIENGVLSKYIGNKKEIVIPDGIISIGSRAFKDCYGITSVVIPSSVSAIGYEAFRGCYSLESVVIPEGVIFIGGCAFADCEHLKSVVIPSGVTTIGYQAFYECNSLTSVVIPGSVFNIEQCAFELCRKLADVTILNGVKGIEFNAFSKCFALRSVELPDSLISIGSSAFGNCSSLTHVKIPDRVSKIDSSPFDGCTSLVNIEVSKNNPYCFSLNGDLYAYKDNGIVFVQYSAGKPDTAFAIPHGVTKIGDRAFSDCQLTDLVIAKSVEKLGYDVFYNSPKLRIILRDPNKIYKFRDNEDWNKHNVNKVNYGECKVYDIDGNQLMANL